ncbi:hypothetical protein BCR37DRAFT_390877 [Protomyces lactucae-debilis]|uniref:Uncharacterized protein n=1 Tax=Protomyces lactucae-debilis TaxID=2754530 RepID=A0A1Y2FQ70_PROLT|nr:uncharacterized protein BCR37DRAFT_390877 [Protomyces lactucae-debilis]ORY86079.1 hypothetical protein BCR37DRAFT_390877 [Protomyces lactucae-debilis]
MTSSCTVILTTSPIPSCPSTELLEESLHSLPAVLKQANLVIVFDTPSRLAEQSRLKKGWVAPEIANVYPEYISRVKNLFGPVGTGWFEHKASVSRPQDEQFKSRVVFLQPDRRMGFGWAVHLALKFVATPLVLVLQHDWIFRCCLDSMGDLIDIMLQESAVQYITFITRGTQRYLSTTVTSHANFQGVFDQFSKDPSMERIASLGLVPCMHFFDRPHLCNVDTYQKVFATRICKRGQFLEDSFGTCYLTGIQQAKGKEEAFAAWQEFGCFLYCPEDGSNIVLSHTHGRLVLEKKAQMERIQAYIAKNNKAMGDINH